MESGKFGKSWYTDYIPTMIIFLLLFQNKSEKKWYTLPSLASSLAQAYSGSSLATALVGSWGHKHQHKKKKKQLQQQQQQQQQQHQI